MQKRNTFIIDLGKNKKKATWKQSEPHKNYLS